MYRVRHLRRKPQPQSASETTALAREQAQPQPASSHIDLFFYATRPINSRKNRTAAQVTLLLVAWLGSAFPDRDGPPTEPPF